MHMQLHFQDKSKEKLLKISKDQLEYLKTGG